MADQYCLVCNTHLHSTQLCPKLQGFGEIVVKPYIGNNNFPIGHGGGRGGRSSGWGGRSGGRGEYSGGWGGRSGGRGGQTFGITGRQLSRGGQGNDGNGIEEQQESDKKDEEGPSTSTSMMEENKDDDDVHQALEAPLKDEEGNDDEF